MRILSSLIVSGVLDIDTINNAAADTDKFLVADANGVVKFRTGAEVASDIGASVGYVSTVKHEVKLGEAIAKGQAVYVTSSDGTNMIVSKASNATDVTSSKTLGLLETGGAANAKVFVITEGLLAGLDTSTATAGAPVWLGTDGNLLYGLAAKPVAPAHMVFIGIVTRVNANNGEIFVKVQNGFELEELHNVLITGTPVDKAVIQYDTASGLWKNSALSGVTGSGAAGQVAYFTGATTQSGSNNLFWDNTNGRLGIGTNTPLARYHQTQGTGIFGVYYMTNANADQNRAGWELYTNTAATPDFFGRYGFKFEGGSNNQSRQFQIHVGDATTPKLALNGSGNLMVGSITDNGLRFQVTGDGSFSSNLGIGTSLSLLPRTNLLVSKNITGSSASFGIISNGVIQSDVLTAGRYVQTIASTQATVFTLANLMHFYSEQGTFGAGSTVSNQYGYFAHSSLTGATNNYGFYGDIASGTGRWNLYMNGTANNYMAGRLGIAFSDPKTKLDVRGTSASAESTIQIVGSGISTLLLGQNADGGVIRGQGGNNALTFWTGGVGDTGASSSGTERMRLDSSGNLGLGTASPNKLLTLSSTFPEINLRRSDSTTATAAINFTGNDNVTKWQLATNVNVGGGHLEFNYTTSTLMLLRANGNLLLGTTTDAGYKLDVNGTMRVSGASTFNDIISITKNQNAATNIITYNTTNGTNSYVSYQASSNNAGIMEIGKFSQTKTAYKASASGDGFIYNSQYGDISILNDFATGAIKLTAGGSSTAHFTIASTGAATFSSTVTGSSFIKTGGLSTEILRADGQVYLFPLGISSPSAGQVLKYNGTSWVNDSDAGITGSGVAGQVAYFTGATTQSGSNNLFWNNTSVRLGIGTNNPQAMLDVAQGIRVNSGGIVTSSFANGLNMGTWDAIGYNAAGNTVVIGGYRASQWSAIGFYTSGNEVARINGGNFIINNASTDNGLRFQVTGDGFFSGAVGIGSTDLVGMNLRIGKTITGGSTSNSVFQIGQVQSDVNVAAYGFRNRQTTQAASFTLQNYYHFASEEGTIGAGSAINNQYGFFVNSNMVGATNNYGFYGNIASGTGRWNLYMNGTASNYLAGDLRFGANAAGPDTALIKWQGSTALIPNSLGIFTWGDAKDIQIGGANVYFRTEAGTQRMLLNSSGNLGLGVTPFSWAAGTRAIDFGSGSAIWNPGSVTNTYITTNAYYDITDNRWEYKGTGGAGNYHQFGSEHRWNQAAAGTANQPITFTQAMTLDASGNLGVGTPNPTTRLDVRGNTIVYGQITTTDNSYKLDLGITSNDAFLQAYKISDLTATNIRFYTSTSEKMRLWGTTGNLAIGGAFASDAGFKLDVNGTMRVSGASTFGASIIASGLISAATEFRLNNQAFSKVAILDAGGGFAGGYNFNLSGSTPQHSLTGAIAGYYFGSGGTINFYTGSSQAAGTNATTRLTIASDGAATFSSSVVSNSSITANNGIYASASGVGYISLLQGTAGGSGYVNFYSTGGVRQGYIGFSTTTATTDAGTLPYVAGTHAFTGAATFSSSVQAGGGTINTSAILQADSTTKGFLPPRMTAAQRTAIATPAEGLIVVQTDGVVGLYIYINSTWRSLTMV